MTIEERIEIEQDGKSYEWTKDQLNEYLETKDWDEETKRMHRKAFKGFIAFESGGIFYE